MSAADKSRVGRALGLWLLALLAGAAGMYLVRQGSPRVSSTGALPPSPVEIAALKYTPPSGRNEAMQAFDKALLFLVAQQEADGHWSARKTGAAEDFCNENGDIVLTAIGTYGLMSAIIGTEARPDLVEGSKRGLRWLKAKVRADGGVSDENGPGDPVLAQIFAGLAFIQAATTSPRDEWTSVAGLTSRHCLKTMMAKPGGFGARPRDEHARMDMTALGSFLYTMAFQSGVRFSEGAEVETLGAELRIEKNTQAALRLMRIDAEKRDGVFRMSSAGGGADFDATLVALLGQLMGNIPPKEYTPGFEFLIGAAAAGEFPGPGGKLQWGTSGEGYRALSIWLGTLAIWLHGETTQEYKAWKKAVEGAVLKHQSPDGSWPAAGSDARYGRMWRTTFTAFSLLMLNPAPPPPGAPVEPPPPPPPPPPAK